MTFFPISLLFKESSIQFPSKEGIIILNPSTIEEALNTYQNLFILFHSPYSFNDNQILSKFAKLKLKITDDYNLTFGKIDTEYYDLISEKYDIIEIPSIILFINGENKEIYKNDINEGDIIKWLYKRLKSPIYFINSLNDINEYQNGDNYSYIYFGQNEKI